MNNFEYIKTLSKDEQQKLIKKCINALVEINNMNHGTKMLRLLI